MVRVIFDGSNLSLERIQTGSGPIAYFEGFPYQRGYGSIRQRGAGVGSVLKTIWRYLKPITATISPIAASIGKEIGKEGLETSARVLSKVVQGGDIQEALAGESKEGVRRLLSKASSRLQEGGGQRRKRKNQSKTRIILKPNDLIGQTVPQSTLLKKRRVDSLGYY